MSRVRKARVEIPNATWVDLVTAPDATTSVVVRAVWVEGFAANPWVEWRESTSGDVLAHSDGGSLVITRRRWAPNHLRLAPGADLQARSRAGGAAGMYAHAAYWLDIGGPGVSRNLEFAEASPALTTWTTIVAAPTGGQFLRIWGGSAAATTGNHAYQYREIGGSDILLVTGSVAGQGSSIELAPDHIDLPAETGLEAQATLGGGAGGSAGVHYTVETDSGAP